VPDQPASLALNVVLHDVTPESWPVYQDFIHAVDALGRVPLTLLVVPDFHHQFHLDRFPDFRNAIEQRIACGDEVVLHGYYHHDDSPLQPNPVNWFMRRIYTHEGEFYSLDEMHARQRLGTRAGTVPPLSLAGGRFRRACVADEPGNASRSAWLAIALYQRPDRTHPPAGLAASGHSRRWCGVRAAPGGAGPRVTGISSV